MKTDPIHPAPRTGKLATAAILFLVIAGPATTLAADPPAPLDTSSLPGTLRTVGVALAAALAIAFSVCGASYAVGRIGSAALGAAAEKPELLIRSLIFVALAEGLAVLGFAIAMMLVQKM